MATLSLRHVMGRENTRMCRAHLGTPSAYSCYPACVARPLSAALSSCAALTKSASLYLLHNKPLSTLQFQHCGCTVPRVGSRVFEQTSRYMICPFTLPCCCRGTLLSTQLHPNASSSILHFRELNIKAHTIRTSFSRRTGSSDRPWIRQRSNVIKAHKQEAARDATVDLLFLLHTHLTGLRSRSCLPTAALLLSRGNPTILTTALLDHMSDWLLLIHVYAIQPIGSAHIGKMQLSISVSGPALVLCKACAKHAPLQR